MWNFPRETLLSSVDISMPFFGFYLEFPDVVVRIIQTDDVSVNLFILFYVILNIKYVIKLFKYLF